MKLIIIPIAKHNNVFLVHNVKLNVVLSKKGICLSRLKTNMIQEECSFPIKLGRIYMAFKKLHDDNLPKD